MGEYSGSWKNSRGRLQPQGIALGQGFWLVDKDVCPHSGIGVTSRSRVTEIGKIAHSSLKYDLLGSLFTFPESLEGQLRAGLSTVRVQSYFKFLNEGCAGPLWKWLE